jgi:hypothetical protein
MEIQVDMNTIMRAAAAAYCRRAEAEAVGGRLAMSIVRTKKKSFQLLARDQRPPS